MDKSFIPTLGSNLMALTLHNRCIIAALSTSASLSVVLSSERVLLGSVAHKEKATPANWGRDATICLRKSPTVWEWLNFATNLQWWKWRLLDNRHHLQKDSSADNWHVVLMTWSNTTRSPSSLCLLMVTCGENGGQGVRGSWSLWWIDAARHTYPSPAWPG